MNKNLTAFLIVAVTLLSGPAFSNHPQDKPRAGKASKEEMEDKVASKQKGEPKKVPEGVSVKGGTVTLKTGYQFVKQTGGAIAVEKKGGGTITGTFTCSCSSSSESKGDCAFSNDGSTAKCFGLLCSNCVLETITRPAAATTGTKIKK